jgi:hypothetical protein
MARKKDLGGLAALAGLAYMMTRDKAQKGLAPVEDAPKAVPGTFKAEEAEPPKDLGEIRDDDGTLSKLRRNTETGELYDPVGSNLSKTTASPPKAAATRSVAALRTATPRIVTPEEGARAYRSRARVDPREALMRNYKPRRNPEPLNGVAEEGMKKGGSVKGWGMARGARKAKNY